jgi:hypothetical protein
MRDLRRIHLAQRMIRYEVRTTTVSAWTGLTEERIRNLAKSYKTARSHSNRHRGPAPRRVDVFLRYNIMRSEAACLGGLARSFDVFPHGHMPDAARKLPGVALGERLCHTFEVYRAVVPEGRLTMEHSILLVLALAQGEEIELDHCSHCTGVIIVEAGFRERRICFACRESKRAGVRLASEEDSAEAALHGGVQQPLF